MVKPVTILTGFLGAGKTTFLNHIIQRHSEIRYAIIENEYGEEGIDNELIIQPNDTIVEMNNGCLCCTLNDNLYEILNDLYERSDDFDEIIIEATGVADPSGLAQPFIMHPLIKKHFPLVSTICLIDVELIEDQLRDTEEAINQITNSDILLLNKTDLVSPEYVTALEAKIRDLNPLATMLKGNRSNFPEVDYHRGSADTEKRLEELPDADHAGMSFPVEKPHAHHHHHEHTKDIISLSFVNNDSPYNFETLRQQLWVYLTFQAQNLYRMKGIFWIDGEEEQYVIQSAGKRLVVDVKRKWDTDEKRKSTVVFIGKELQRNGLEKMLKRCVAKQKNTTK